MNLTNLEATTTAFVYNSPNIFSIFCINQFLLSNTFSFFMKLFCWSTQFFFLMSLESSANFNLVFKFLAFSYTFFGCCESWLRWLKLVYTECHGPHTSQIASKWALFSPLFSVCPDHTDHWIIVITCPTEKNDETCKKHLPVHSVTLTSRLLQEWLLQSFWYYMQTEPWNWS